MKRCYTILSFLLLSTVLSIPSSAEDKKGTVDSSRVTTPDNKIIPYQRIGAIRLGMGMDEVQSLLGKPSSWEYGLGRAKKDISNANRWFYNDLNLSIYFTASNTPTVSMVQTVVFSHKSRQYDQVYWKDVEPVKVVFQTAEGIKLGSSAFDVKRAYGNDYNDRGSSGLVMQYTSLGLRFWLTVDHNVRMIDLFQQP